MLGSSPLARGLLFFKPYRGLTPRIIPARAGFTSRSPTARSRRRDHPRSRGVYRRWSVVVMWCSGSSPLARGLRYRPCRRGPPARIIPARAGFTLRVGPFAFLLRDHPRSRGVYVGGGVERDHAAGSSPLARGLHSSLMIRPDQLRIIPARAGFTARRTRARRSRADHPRSRGVYSPWLSAVSARWGSSPLARGLLRRGGAQ